MLQINKNSHLVTVSGNTKLSELKSELVQEGLYFGYYPLDEIHFSINHYLKRRITNLYNFKYGSLSDLLSSALIQLNYKEKSFHLKDAPRSAIGPDFNKMIVGSKEFLGHIKTATLKIVSIPESVIQCVVLLKSKETAKTLTSYLMGQFIHPMYFRYFDLNSSVKLLNDLKIKTKKDEALVLCFSGLREIVDTHQKVISDYCNSKNLDINWIDKKHEHEIIHSHIHNLDSYREIKEQYRYFLWPASDNSSQSLWEKGFVESLGKM